jgi:hypothetical protein
MPGPCFQSGGAYEAQGAVWELLQAGGPDAPRAEALLRGGCEPAALPRCHALLELLQLASECRDARKGGLLGPGVRLALQELAVQLQAAGREAAPAGRAAAVVSEDGASGTSRHAGLEEEDELHGVPADPEVLARRRAHRLRPLCLRLVKQLLASGKGPEASGGKTD